jgi:hypothetical protein
MGSLVMMNSRQFMLGAFVLMVGVVFYLLFRDRTYFLMSLHIPVMSAGNNARGFIWGSLPTFIHVISFSMLTASLIKYSKINYILVCVFWLTINFAFEIGQKYKVLSQRLVPTSFESIPVLESTGDFFLSGIFDINDIGSAFVAAVISFYLLQSTAKRRNDDEY